MKKLILTLALINSLAVAAVAEESTDGRERSEVASNPERTGTMDGITVTTTTDSVVVSAARELSADELMVVLQELAPDVVSDSYGYYNYNYQYQYLTLPLQT